MLWNASTREQRTRPSAAGWKRSASSAALQVGSVPPRLRRCAPNMWLSSAAQREQFAQRARAYDAARRGRRASNALCSAHLASGAVPPDSSRLLKAPLRFAMDSQSLLLDEEAEEPQLAPTPAPGYSLRARLVLAVSTVVVIGFVVGVVWSQHDRHAAKHTDPDVASFSSLDVPAQDWSCTYTTSRLDISFAAAGGPSAIACGFPEALQNSTTYLSVPGEGTYSGFAPTFTFADAVDGPLYTLIVTDRDAQSRESPLQGPIRHLADGNIRGSSLRAGYGTSGISALWFNYSGPHPPAWSGCHRYFAHLYTQPRALGVADLPNPQSRTNWDFVSWAANLTLVKVAENFWMTQCARDCANAGDSAETNPARPPCRDLGNRSQPCY